jgi:hypothetical protein
MPKLFALSISIVNGITFGETITDYVAAVKELEEDTLVESKPVL